MSIFNSIVSDLREKRLWPVALVLLAGLVAVPALLAKSGPPVPAGAATAPVSPSTPGLPVVSVDSAQAQSQLPGPGRDPFTQQPLPGGSGAGSGTTPSGAGTGSTGPTTGGTGTLSPTTSGGSGASGGSSTGGGSATGASTGSGVTTPSTTTTSTTTSPAEPSPTPKPTGLTDTEAYHVTLSLTNASGGLNTISPLERLAVLPSQKTPLLVELGVLKGGHRILLAVQPGTGVRGRGTCIPGPIDCQILSLGQNQVETLSSASRADVAQLAVTGINAARYRSSAAASEARKQVSAAGRRLLSRSGLIALGLFQYKPGLGAVVDLRNLDIGGQLMRRVRLLGLALVVSLLAISGEAGAVVIDMGSAGRFGVAPVPGTSIPNPPVIPSASPPCSDPWLASDLSLPDSGLCYRGSQPHNHSSRTLHARLQLVPQGLGSMLRYGVALRVTSNQKADGIATLSISRKLAKRAHIRTGRGTTVVIGRGTVSGIRNGTVKLHLRLSRTIKSKLGHMGHVTVTVRLALFASGGDHIAVDVAGRY